MADRILTEEEKVAQERRGLLPAVPSGRATSHALGSADREVPEHRARRPGDCSASWHRTRCSCGRHGLRPRERRPHRPWSQDPRPRPDLIFSGLFSKQIPANVTQEQAVEGMRAQGETKPADMLAAMEHIRPGQGRRLHRRPVSSSSPLPCMPCRASCRGRRHASSCGSSTPPFIACAATSRPNWADSRCPTSIPSRAASC